MRKIDNRCLSGPPPKKTNIYRYFNLPVKQRTREIRE
jgi:hypothetical protein